MFTTRWLFWRRTCPTCQTHRYPNHMSLLVKEQSLDANARDSLQRCLNMEVGCALLLVTALEKRWRRSCVACNASFRTSSTLLKLSVVSFSFPRSWSTTRTVWLALWLLLPPPLPEACWSSCSSVFCAPSCKWITCCRCTCYISLEMTYYYYVSQCL